MKFLKILLLVFITFFAVSCVKDVDFDQANDITLTPSYIVSLVNFKIPQTNLIDRVTGNEVLTITDESDIKILRTEEAQKYLEKLLLKVEIANTFNRDFIMTFNFLDDNDIATYKPIQLSVSAQDLAFKHEEEILVVSNSSFLKTTKVKATLQLQPSADGSVIDTRKDDTFTLKSAATVFLRVKN